MKKYLKLAACGLLYWLSYAARKTAVGLIWLDGRFGYWRLDRLQ